MKIDPQNAPSFHCRLTRFSLKPRRLLVLACLLFAVGSAWAQVNLTGIPYSQDFDALGSSGSWTDNSTLTGWYAANNSADVVTLYTAYSNTGGGGTSSSTLYSMGTSSGDPDRALGGAPASTRYTMLGLRLVNDTGSIFDDIQVSYDFEQWSDRGEATITMSYQIFSAGAGSLATLTGWNTLTATVSPLPTASPATSGIGNTTGLIAGVTGGATSLGLQAGDELWIRWAITKISGNNSTHGIDNVVVAVPEPSTAALLGIGLLLLLGRLRPSRIG